MAQPSNQEEILTCFKSKVQAAEHESETEVCNSGSGKLKSEPTRIVAVGKLEKAEGAEEQKAKQAVTGAKGLNRCSKCRKRVGLSGGFRCRCGMMYCGEHRYSDRHDCGYDYKKLGRERIEKDNPLIRAAKVIRI